MKKRFIFTLGIIFCFLIFISYFFSTPLGLNALFKLYLLKYAEPKNIFIEKTSGNLLQGVRFENILIFEAWGLPLGISVKIQEINFFFPDFNPRNINFKITNAKLKLYNAGDILFHGAYRNKELDLNFFANRVDLNRDFVLFYQRFIKKDFSGVITGPDIFFKGARQKKKVNGKLTVQNITFRGFNLKECPVSFAGVYKEEKNALKAWGKVVLGEGLLTIRNTGIKIKQGKIIYSGNLKKPFFNLEGEALVGQIKINLIFKGTLDKPDLRLTSEPPLPQDVLLLILATGEPWGGVEKSFLSGQLNPDLIKDFIDYFVLGGSASKFAKSLGISDISLKYDGESKGIKATTSISEKLGISYGVEEKIPQGAASATIQQNVGAQLKVTDSVSIEAERQIKEQENQALDGALKHDDKVLLKYKKKF